MGQATALTKVLVGACEHLAAARRVHLLKDLDRRWIEVHRAGERRRPDLPQRPRLAFHRRNRPDSGDPSKDVFEFLEEAIDATRKAAQILEGIVIKNA